MKKTTNKEKIITNIISVIGLLAGIGFLVTTILRMMYPSVSPWYSLICAIIGVGIEIVLLIRSKRESKKN
ncbi:MAG: hypothetical protein J5750_01950 [Clostridiales bacterium]|nr:hypothetical protein [Clostridiales bacterium]